MELSQIRYFLKTAELLNYTHASQELYITRQSLRQAIASIEEELGRPLFVNTRNKLSLTEYGAYMAAAGADVIRAYESMIEGLHLLASRQTALRVAFSSCLFPFMLPDTEVILRAFRARFPDIRLDIAQMDNDDVIDAVERGDIDCGCVIQMPCRRECSSMRVLCTYDAAVDFCAGSPLYGKREVALEDLAGIPLIGMGSLQKTLHPVWEACAARGISLRYQPVISTIDAFYQIQHGLAAGFDILKTDVPDFSWEYTSLLVGFSWEIGFLCHDSCRDPHLLELFCSFMDEEYKTRWKRHQREWNV